MNKYLRWFAILWMLAPTFFLGTFFPRIASGQLPSVAASRLGVDEIRLSSGHRLYGFVLAAPDQDHLRVAIERQWLQGTYPDLYKISNDEEKEQAQCIHEQVLERARKWLEEHAEDDILRRHIQSLIAEVEHTDVAAPKTQFMIYDVPRTEVARVRLAKPRLRTIAGLAFQHHLDSPTTTPASLLERKLIATGIDPSKETVDLSDRLPAAHQESPKQWSARKALIEWSVSQPVEFQGVGDHLVRVDNGPVVELGAINALFQNAALGDIVKLNSELQLIDPSTLPGGARQTDRWWQELTKQAESASATGFLAIRLTENPTQPVVQVDAYFFARHDDGSWFQVYHTRAVANVNDQSADRIEQLKNDPRIAQVLRVVAALGITPDDVVGQALRQGAAVEEALGKAKSDFNQFVTRHTRSLLAPPIPLGTP